MKRTVALVCLAVVLAFQAILVSQVSFEPAVRKNVTAQRVNKIRMADQFGTSSSNAGQRIALAIADGPSTGVHVDASSLEGSQTISADMFSGVTKPGTLECGPSATFNTSVPQQIPSNWKIKGCLFVATSVTLPAIPETGSPSAVLYIKSGESNVAIEDTVVEGAYSGTGAASITFGIYVGDGATNVTLHNVYSHHNSWSSILLKGSGHSLSNIYTFHNAIDGIESFADDVRIQNFHSLEDSSDQVTMAAEGTGCLEILPGSERVNIDTGTCRNSGHNGVVISDGMDATEAITISNFTVTTPATRGFADNQGVDGLKVSHATVIDPQGSGALGHAFYLANTTNFVLDDITGSGATVDDGPSGLQIEGSADHGVVINSIFHHNWVGIGLAGAAGTNGSILLNNNKAYSNGGLDYSNTSSGDFIYPLCNSFDETAAGCEAPQLITPLVYGGADVASVLKLTSTTANGTSSVVGIEFRGGNVGGTRLGGVCNNGNWLLGDSTNCSLTENIAAIDKSFGVVSTTTTDAKLYIRNTNGSGKNWSFRGRNDGGVRLVDDSTSVDTLAFTTSHLTAIKALNTATGNMMCFDNTTISGMITFADCTSLRRLKKNFRALPPSISDFMKLKPMQFDWRNDGSTHYGFVAEDVRDVNPLLATYKPDGSLVGVDYNGIVALLVRAVQEQQRQIDALKARR